MKKAALLLSTVVLFGTFLVAGDGNISNRAEGLLNRADSLKREYHFNEAMLLYREVMALSKDSLTNIKATLALAECENGINMLQYATTPTVDARKTIPKEQFYLRLPEVERRYRLPDSISSDVPPFSQHNFAIFSPDSLTLYYSAKSEEGYWNIYSSHLIDGEIWSSPKELTGDVNSTGNELFPKLSRDGKKLYFTSDGHFGMGGYDLYVSEWSELTEEWGIPQNLGFPFSSVDNDLLFFHSSCGQYSYLISDREASQDSLNLYRLEFEANPLKRAISSVSEAVELVSLALSNGKTGNGKEEIGAAMTQPETDLYTKKVLETRKMQEQIDSLSREIAKKRESYSALTEIGEQERVAREIVVDEQQLIERQRELNQANSQLQKLEMEFLAKGILIPRAIEREPERRPDESDKKEPLIVIESQLHPFPQIKFLPEVEPFDYTLQVDTLSIMSPVQEFPEGIVYRIQLIAVNREVSNLNTFKGLRPIYHSRNASGRYLYSAGQFHSYREAQRGLALVKRSGFPSAIIAPFYDGKPISLRNAREREEREAALKTYQIKIEGYPAGMPQTVLDYIRGKTDRDIARKSIDNREVYFIGPFNNKNKAEEILELFSNLGAEKVSIESIEESAPTP